jgi:predicted enzyme related to lactoylglutathione lyase
MNKLVLGVVLCLSFSLGFPFRHQLDKPSTPRRVTSIGGIFFKAKDPAKLREWYAQHLGLVVNPYGSVFEWYQGADSTKKGFTQWSPFKESTKYFQPSTKEFMINYRVENMDWLLGELKKEGIEPVDSVESASYGKFVHLMDIEGNKIELWEPNDVEYEKIGRESNMGTTK